ncbi:MAG TPA: response regulator [Candidatus Acidoferrales bacterium]|jgi:CheY-like chemotaxis protein|nr:response regulator [Candidatus Acidoferrales bacterium]
MSKKTEATIMVVDDDPKIVKALSLRLNSAGYRTVTSFNGMTALILAQVKKPDLVITDMWMPAGTGLSMAYRMKDLMPGIPLIFLTASKQPGLENKARELGAVGYLEKPYEPTVLLEMVARLLKEKGQPPQAEQLDLAVAPAN